MTPIAATEQAIVARLSEALTAPGARHPVVEVCAWPDAPLDFRAIHPVGTVLVLYRGTQFAHNATAGQRITWQEQFEIALLARTLRSHDGAAVASGIDTGVYGLVDSVRRALTGWVPPMACGQVQLAGIEFAEYAEGVWQYALRCAVPMTTVADRPRPAGPWAVDDEDAAPPLVRRNFQQ
ncbi:MAG: DUF1834 family protein [Rhodocyclaceae bacterium]|nr:DUF1834 family protein [Rhodocyclaceae bacterium]